MLGTLGLAVAAKLQAATGANPFSRSVATAGAAADAPYGSGHFGRWAEDEFGLPTFEYACNQVTDPLAVSPIKPGILLPTEHIHQVGNDRITAIASNFGHVRVRQDEGGPKVLNDVDPEASQYGGGFGYLTDGAETLSTWYDGNNPNFERIFGIGYFRKRVANMKYAADQVIWAPFGDDPVLISQVKITNHGAAPADLTWIEYWGCQPYQLSFRDFIEAMAAKTTDTELRRILGHRFTHKITRIGADGLLDAKIFLGRTPEEEARWQGIKAYFKAHPNDFIANIEDDKPGAWYDAGEIPQTFLVSLDGPADACATDAEAFFGAGGPAHPSGITTALTANPGDPGTHGALILARQFHLAAGEERTLTFLYGYLTEGFQLEKLITKYRASAPNGLKSSSAEWKQRGLRFEAADEPWIRREAAWNHYYVRSSMTFDDYFGEHILNQNGLYQWDWGFQGAARDPLQHSMPFLFSDPEIVRSVLRYTLKEVRDDGSIPYGIVGHGVIMPTTSDNVSDVPLWLLWTASEYVLATRDTAFLDQSISARYSAQPGRTDTVRNLLARCLHREVDLVGVGQHGVMRMLNDDWNDGLVGTWATSNYKECIEQGESVLNTTMAAWVYDYYSRMLGFAGDTSGTAAKAAENAEKMRQAARAQWTGKWFRRCWLGPALGWLGEDTLWIEPQPWAIVSGTTTPAQSKELVQTMNALLRRSQFGACQMSDGPDLRKAGTSGLGEGERGAVWPSLNQTLVWALAQVDPAMAWNEWKKNSLARHAHVYPNVWYGVWSGPDTYNSIWSDHPGETCLDSGFHVVNFPVLNIHSHACYLYGAAKLLGVEFTPEGLILAPEIPAESYKFESPLLGVVKKAAGRYEGWYEPSKPGTWTIQVKLPEQVAKAVSRVEVNGAAVAKKMVGGAIEMRGASAPHQPMRWSIG